MAEVIAINLPAPSDAVEGCSDGSSSDLLAEYEEMFGDRYTDLDPDYVLTRDLPLAPPPCVENWYIKPKRTFDWARNDNRGRGRGRGYGNWRNHGRDNYREDRGYNNRGYDRDYQSHGHNRHDNRGYRDQRHGGDRNYGGDRGYGGGRNYGGGRGSDRVHYAGVRDSSQSHQRQGDRYHPYNK